MSDLISRQAAIDAIHNLYAIHGSEGSWIVQKDAFKALNSLPSAEPVRHGKWESLTFTNASNEEYTMHRCSECGLTIATGWYHYCPNCGARMDKDV